MCALARSSAASQITAVATRGASARRRNRTEELHELTLLEVSSGGEASSGVSSQLCGACRDHAAPPGWSSPRRPRSPQGRWPAPADSPVGRQGSLGVPRRPQPQDPGQRARHEQVRADVEPDEPGRRDAGLARRQERRRGKVVHEHACETAAAAYPTYRDAEEVAGPDHERPSVPRATASPNSPINTGGRGPAGPPWASPWKRPLAQPCGPT